MSLTQPEDPTTAKFAGFSTQEQELKYNLSVVDLIMTLAARVTVSLQTRKPQTYFSFK